MTTCAPILTYLVYTQPPEGGVAGSVNVVPVTSDTLPLSNISVRRVNLRQQMKSTYTSILSPHNAELRAHEDFVS